MDKIPWLESMDERELRRKRLGKKMSFKMRVEITVRQVNRWFTWEESCVIYLTDVPTEMTELLFSAVSARAITFVYNKQLPERSVVSGIRCSWSRFWCRKNKLTAFRCQMSWKMTKPDLYFCACLNWGGCFCVCCLHFGCLCFVSLFFGHEYDLTRISGLEVIKMRGVKLLTLLVYEAAAVMLGGRSDGRRWQVKLLSFSLPFPLHSPWLILHWNENDRCSQAAARSMGYVIYVSW